MKRTTTFLLIVLAIMQTWAIAPQSGKIYKIVNPSRGNLKIAEDILGHVVYCPGDLNGKVYQYWQLEQSGNNWTIKNVYTGRYLQNQNTIYQSFTTGTNPATFNIIENSTVGNDYYTIKNGNGSWGLHCDAAAALVPYSADSSSPGGSSWRFEEVNISAEEIAAAQQEYSDFAKVSESSQAIISNYSKFYDDPLCMQLKSNYASMSDEQLKEAMNGIPADLVAAALKVKNNSWKKWEKEFRLHTYEPYSDPDVWGTKLLTKKYTWQNNPTGIYANTANVVYVFVGNDVPANATLELEALTDNGATGTRTTISKGMNIVPISRDLQTLFVIYTANTTNGKSISDFPNIDIRIEGGVLNGYWDIERHNDTDWVEISQQLATHPYIVVKGENLIFNMVREYIIKPGYCEKKITDAIGWWDNMAEWQWEIMGIEDVRPSHFNNKLCARTLPTGYQSATHYYTQYLASYINNLLPYENMMSNADNCWGPAHENGHVQQEAITPINCSEVSNNLFSNLVLYKLGRWQSRGGSISEIANEYTQGLSWPSHSNHLMLRMYWQLYLYYHVAGNNPQFYPTLFKLLREDPIIKVGSSNKSYINKGSEDLLHFAEKCCEAANEDLTDFFEAWGFFVPMNENYYGDYADYYLTSTPEMIAATKEKMAQYTKKAGGIQFIEDRVKGIPRTDGGSGNKLSHSASVSDAGELGHYTDFTPEKMNTEAKGYVYNKSTNSISITSGSGAVGFKILDSEGKMITYANEHKIQLSALVLSSDFTVVAVQANGAEVEVPSAAIAGTEEEQLQALNSALTSANSCINNTSTNGLQVGFFYEHATVKLKELYAQAKAAKDNADQSVHTYGEWAIILENEIKAIKSDPYAYIGIKEKNIHTIVNRNYQSYGFAYDNGTLSGVSNSQIPRDDERRNWEFEKAEATGEFYIKCSNGYYISALNNDELAEARTKSKSSALVFVARNNGDATFSFYLKNTPEVFMIMNKERKAIGGKDGSSNANWRLTIVENNAPQYEAAKLTELISEAERIVEEIGSIDGITVNIASNIHVIANNFNELALALYAAKNDAIENRETAINPAKIIDTLQAAIANINGTYFIKNPRESTDNNIVWYYIKNIEDGTYCSVDTVKTTLAYSKAISLEPLDKDNRYYWWAFEATDNDGEYKIFNGKTGEAIYTYAKSPNSIKTDGAEEASAYTITFDEQNLGNTISSGKGYWNNSNASYVRETNVVSYWQLIQICIEEGNLTGIEEITNSEETVRGIYDLSGRPIDEITVPGIYIVNGKKLLVK